MGRQEFGPRRWPELSHWLAPPALVAGLAAIVFWTHAPYLELPHAHDDRLLQLMAGLKETGRLGWIGYLLPTYEGHFLPGWRLLYLIQVRWFGAEAWPWHVATSLAQAVSALLVYCLLARWLRDRVAAAAGAALWAGAAIGRWDNPHAWIAAGLNVHALAWLLAAMWCQAQYAQSSRTRWALGVALCLSVAACFSGHVLALFPVLPAQAVLLDEIGLRSKRAMVLLAAWGIPITVLVAAHFVAFATSGVPSSFRPESMFDVAGVLRTVSAQALVALEHLTGFGPVSSQAWPPAWRLALLIGGSVIVLFIPGVNRRLIVVFATLGLLHLLAARALRGDLPVGAALGWGRYLYESTLSWCIVAAALMAALRLRFHATQGRVVMTGVCMALCAISIARQRPLAGAGAAEFRAIHAADQAQFARNVDLLRTLEATAAAGKTALRVPDIPLDVPAAAGTYYPLSVFIAVNLRSELPHLQVMPLSPWTNGDDEPWRAAISQCPHDEAARWEARSDSVAEWLEAVRWINAEALREENPYIVPNVELTLPPLEFPLRQMIAFAMSAWPANIRVVEPGELTVDAWRRQQSRLAGKENTSIPFWSQVYRQVTAPSALRAQGP